MPCRWTQFLRFSRVARQVIVLKEASAQVKTDRGTELSDVQGSVPA